LHALVCFSLARVDGQNALIKHKGPFRPLHGLINPSQLSQGQDVMRVQLKGLLEAGLSAGQVAGLVP
jgi:hypothetical protein